MNRLTNEERLRIVQIYFENRSSVRATYRALRPIYGPHNRPSESGIRALVNRFRDTHTLVDKHRQRRRTVRTEEAVDAVARSVEEDPSVSIRHRAQQLAICYSTLRNILRKDLRLYPYKIQLVQELKRLDYRKRLDFVEWAQDKITRDPAFAGKIFFSDEAHFWLCGFVNKQNCRIWSNENPKEFVGVPLHPQKLTVWCAIWAGGVIGPYFFKDNAGQTVTVNGQRYRAMLRDFFVPQLNELEVDLENVWFQQDGATCHTANDTIGLLAETFGERIISFRGSVNWPPRSCDITPTDYFLWGYVKSQVYADKPQTLNELEANIRRVIGGIQPQLLERVFENWTTRLGFLRERNGAHMPEIIFKR